MSELNAVQSASTMRVNVLKCARCGGEHMELELRPLTRPMAPKDVTKVEWTEWAPCPTNSEPILFAVADDAPAERRAEPLP